MGHWDWSRSVHQVDAVARAGASLGDGFSGRDRAERPPAGRRGRNATSREPADSTASRLSFSQSVAPEAGQPGDMVADPIGGGRRGLSGSGRRRRARRTVPRHARRPPDRRPSRPGAIELARLARVPRVHREQEPRECRRLRVLRQQPDEREMVLILASELDVASQARPASGVPETRSRTYWSSRSE